MHFIRKQRNREFLYFRKNPGEPFSPRGLLGGSQEAPRKLPGGYRRLQEVPRAPQRLQEVLEAIIDTTLG